MSDVKSSAAGCAYCRLFGRKSTRIPVDVRDKCLKNRTGVCFACQKLTDIERKIDDARRALQSLLDAREQLASTLNEYHDPFVHRLPLEITSRIFVHCRPVEPLVYTSGLRHNEAKLTRAVLSPGRVCKSWRKISRSTPELWTIFCATITPRNCVASVAFTNEWLERSGALPLFIQLRVDDLENGFGLYHNTARKVIGAAVQHAQRWEVLDLHVPPKFLPSLSTTLATKDMRRLSILKLYACNGDNEILYLNASPHRVVQKIGPIDQISIDWTKVTHASFDELGIREAIQLFRCARNLRSCKISDGGYSEEHTPSEPFVAAPSLTHLEIRNFPHTFWDHFIFPSLATLHIADNVGGGCWIRLQDHLRRSSCSIQELTIEDNSGTPEPVGVVGVLKLTRNLTRLTLSGAVRETIFSAMDSAVMPNGNMQLPSDFLKNLESLCCETNLIKFDWSWLVAFLTSMTSRAEGSLQSFSFQYMGQHPEERYTSIMDKSTFKCVLDVVHGLRFKMVDARDQDLVEKLRQVHKL